MTSDATDRVKEDWDSQAESWFRQRDSMYSSSLPIHEWMVDHLELRPGQRILEIAAGPGDTGFLAAKRLDGGRLLSTDLSPSMVESARKRGAELGVTNVDYRVLDAQAMDLPDWSSTACSVAGASCSCRIRSRRSASVAACSFPADDWCLPCSRDPRRTRLLRCRRASSRSGASSPSRRANGSRESSRWLIARDSRRFSTTRHSLHSRGAGGHDMDVQRRRRLLGFPRRPHRAGSADPFATRDARKKFRSAIDAQSTRFANGDRVALPSRCWCGVGIA